MIHQEYHEQEDAPFNVIKKIGHGISGTVDKVQCRKTARIYARKSIQLPRRAYSSSSEDRNKAKIERIQEEARIIRSLQNNHHIVKVIETYVTTSPDYPLFCILLPLADHDLKRAIADVGTIQPGTKKDEAVHKMRHWAACLVRATDYMHDRRVKHKDIKPGNILVHGFWDCKGFCGPGFRKLCHTCRWHVGVLSTRDIPIPAPRQGLGHFLAGLLLPRDGDRNHRGSETRCA
jgi:hypothetical protein